MNKFVLALAVFLTMALSAGQASAFPGSLGGSGILQALADQSILEEVLRCQKGYRPCRSGKSRWRCCPARR